MISDSILARGVEEAADSILKIQKSAGKFLAGDFRSIEIGEGEKQR